MVETNKKFSEEEHPWKYYSVFGKITVSWISPLVKLASSRSLLEEDVWPSPPEATVESLHNRFEEELRKERQKAKETNRDPSLIRAFYNSFGWLFITGGVLQLAFLVFQLGQPFLIGELVDFVRNGTGGIGRGLGLAFGLAGVSLLSSMSITTALFVQRLIGISVRASIMTSIYKHALLLTTSARATTSVGQTTNLMAIDSERLFWAAQFWHFLWHGPVCCIIIMGILIGLVGPAPALAGMAFLILLVQSQTIIAGRVGALRRKMTHLTDERVKFVNEMLQAIRVIKLYAWERPMEDRVNAVRDQELSTLEGYLNTNAAMREMLFMAQPLAVLVIYAVSLYGMNRQLSVVEVFRVLSFLNTTRLPLNLLGVALKFNRDGLVSLERSQKFLILATLQGTLTREKSNNPKIDLEDARFSWQEFEETPNNSDKSMEKKFSAKENSEETTEISPFSMNLTFKTKGPNDLIAVIGTVGSGKSSLISAILGDMPCGSCRKMMVDGTISYCAQSPWIQNMSLRDNVLFGSDYADSNVSDRYEDAIEAAALLPDLKILPNGDGTEIGERGINLSGGQKARVSLARSFFSAHRAQIFLMDDPFSAVDGSTGNLIFESGVLKLLHDKIRIIALNSHLHLLKCFDRIIVMGHGSILADGSPQELAKSHSDLMAVVTGLPPSSLLPLDEKSSLPTFAKTPSSRPTLLGTMQGSHSISPTQSLKDQSLASASIVLSDRYGKAKHGGKAESKDLIHNEKVVSGKVKLLTYIEYFSAALLGRHYVTEKEFYQDVNYSVLSWDRFSLGLLIGVVLMILFTGAQIARVLVDFFIARWSESEQLNNFASHGYYISLGCLILLVYVRSIYLNKLAVRSSRNIHLFLLRSVLSAPIPLFFDTHTIGEVLNRFAKDMEIVDINIPDFLLQLLINWLQVMSAFALCVYASPFFAIVLLPLIIVVYRTYQYFSAASRDLKRLESRTRSPIFSSLSESLNGLDTIRAYGDTGRFLLNNLVRMEKNQRLYFHQWMTLSWVTVRLEIGSTFVTGSIALLAVCLRNSVSAIGLGLALAYSIQLTALFQRCIQLSVEFSTYMTSTERLFEYLKIPQESAKYDLPKGAGKEKEDSHGTSLDSMGKSVDGDEENAPSVDAEGIQLTKYEKLKQSEKLPDTPGSIDSIWPTSGKVTFSNVWMNYRSNPSVLKGINFSIKSGERVGICGRTGAGKSSLMVALFRIVEITGGNILIDNQDITQIPLVKLRSNLAIIPQDPVLFTGTVRFQLDPFNLHSDAEIWNAIEMVSMTEAVKNMPGGMYEHIQENGENLSQGQRQLLCIARALLRKAKVLVVDEGTSAVDPHTDSLIQNVLRKQAEVNGTTVLAIAHRLQTIIDFDRVMVLSAGRVVEFDSPTNLLNNSNSLFAAMVNESN